MQSRSRVLKLFTMDISVQSVMICQMILSFVKIAIWQSCAELAKMIGKEKEMDPSNVQTVSLQNSQEI